MFKAFRDKIALSGTLVLLVGIALLVFTFANAYGFLTQNLLIIPGTDLAQTFGDSFAPLIATCIRIMYLGVMGWTGSLITIRGVTIIVHTHHTEATVQQRAVETGNLSRSQKTTAEPPQREFEKHEIEKTEAANAEPEIAVVSPQEIVQNRSGLPPTKPTGQSEQSPK